MQAQYAYYEYGGSALQVINSLEVLCVVSLWACYNGWLSDGC